jgi:hypothetical protein
MLEGNCRRQEAFSILECLRGGNGPRQHFGPSLQEISQRFQNLYAVGQKMAVKVYHAKKALQLLYVLRGWAIFDFDGMIGS